jgi:hypothetical protein
MVSVPTAAFAAVMAWRKEQSAFQVPSAVSAVLMTVKGALGAANVVAGYSVMERMSKLATMRAARSKLKWDMGNSDSDLRAEKKKGRKNLRGRCA